jgi:acyl-CoA synthetase (NDP forming)
VVAAAEKTGYPVVIKAQSAKLSHKSIAGGVLLESMGGKGVEFIVGARNDRDWNPALLVKFGSVMAELS